MINVAIVEDDPSDAEALAAYLEKFSRETENHIEVSRFGNAVDFLDKYAPRYDIVFMDIDMPLLSGMNAAQRLRQIDGNVLLIFVTNLVQYAVDGYEVNAFDFIVKPIGYYNFSIKLKRALERLDRSSGVTIDIRTREKLTRVSSADIKFVEVYDHNLIYHTSKGDITAVGTLSEAQNLLPEADFYRCSRCYLVNLRYVTVVRGTSVNVGGDEIQISESRRKALFAALADYMRGKGD